MKIFITGVSDGVGKELTKQLIKAGHIVWGIARREELLKKMQSELGSDKFLFTKCDVGNENDVECVMRMMKIANFLPEAVVLNAAVSFQNRDLQYPLFKQATTINVLGSLIWVDKFINDFLKRGSGSFIAISSISAFLPYSNDFPYSTTKAALSMAFRSLLLRYGGNNIDFSVVYFGPIATLLTPHWTNSGGKPKYFFVLSPQKAATSIKKIIESKNKKASYWRPFLLNVLFRILSILPDKLFLFLSNKFKS